MCEPFLRSEMESEPGHRTQKVEGGVSKSKEQVEQSSRKLAVRGARRERKEWRCLLFVCLKTHRSLIGLGTRPLRREEHFGNIPEVESEAGFSLVREDRPWGRWRSDIPPTHFLPPLSSIPMSMEASLPWVNTLNIYISHCFRW